MCKKAGQKSAFERITASQPIDKQSRTMLSTLKLQVWAPVD